MNGLHIGRGWTSWNPWTRWYCGRSGKKQRTQTIYHDVVLKYNSLACLIHQRICLLFKTCLSFVFTLQGPPGFPGPKVIKCKMCHWGCLLSTFCIGKVEWSCSNNCLLGHLLERKNNMTLQKKVPSLTPQAPKAHLVPGPSETNQFFFGPIVKSASIFTADTNACSFPLVIIYTRKQLQVLLE